MTPEDGGARRDPGIVDLHTHLMPGVDDGARDRQQVRAGLESLREEGVGCVVATPHFRASSTTDPATLRGLLGELDHAWGIVGEVARETSLALRVERGVELRLDGPDVDVSDPRLRLAGGDAVLVEFSRFEVPPYGDRQLAMFSDDGWLPVLAHPERYVGLRRRLESVVPAWRDAGAALLVNAGSLLGQYGPDAREAARELLRRGWAAGVTSDYHCRGKPALAPVAELLEEADAGEASRLLLWENPRRLLHGEEPLPVPPVEGLRGLWNQLRRWLG